MDDVVRSIERIAGRLEAHGRVAVAVSGGIDSVTLSAIAARRLGERACMFHAVSPAVPPDATERVRMLAAQWNWRLEIVDAAEFEQADYVANPVNRCFYCKRSLYGTIARVTDSPIVSGTNADDLSDFRPGLDAAREAGVHHPFAEEGIGKPLIRRMARELGLGALSELPASPCLSSRVETGIRVAPDLVRTIHRAEVLVRERTGAEVVRCRYRAAGIVVELAEESLARLDATARAGLAQAVAAAFAAADLAAPVSFAPYRMGSAFLVRGRA